MENENFVVLKNVCKRFGDKTVIGDVDLEIKKGSLVTLLGPSGCGKTTVLRLVAGLEKPTSGQIFIDGEDVTNTSIQQRDICMVFQSYALFPHLSLHDNVGYGLKMIGLSKEEVKQRVDEALRLVDLEGFGERYVDQISGGQQQRVALARALVLKPKVLLFDEPLSNLDANLRRSMRETIRELQQRFNITSLYVTHDQAEAFAVSDTVIVMKDGDIMQQGSPTQLYKHPASMFMANFMGEANIFDGSYDGSHLIINGYKIPADDESVAALPTGNYQIGVRPEAILLCTEGEACQQCEITSIAYMGSMYEVLVKWHNKELLLQLNSSQFDPSYADHAYLSINPVGLFLLPEDA
ncbi:MULTISPECIES: ferric ABC transporter ATP-binding protein [Vibrio]|uniref:CP4-6 prophage ABC transporter ATP-binding protein AfuC n=2 Tax=Vibrio aestuarianus TaxID=28171 RepID=A0A7X6NAT0_9VIBR|nr:MULTISPECIES: ferric ABC transporter ATP-binding protein [Vibrio]MBD1564414.1 ferric ABC transporter ATP-binding protein [Vibrio sp. S12_S33]MDE1209110.1 ferric ABC transporter ATP-binding protein [Vibrio aestuarianus]MDE1228405.1 ferric ABC transporter ATP-binding protein [Vibrio aestuarianus]MDE1232424.1 ferric ABC transporter ATP-binding protein [Vibrio aestuarianus]MDE1236338.1 ferric ABC transporter ATP-binding protein [Vibrio aestuarianus]